jgi:hypothetical protein
MKLLGTHLLNMPSAFHPADGRPSTQSTITEYWKSTCGHMSVRRMTIGNEWLPLAQFAVNNSKQESLKATPFFLNCGRHPRTPAAVTDNTDVPRGWRSSPPRYARRSPRKPSRLAKRPSSGRKPLPGQSNARKDCLHMLGQKVLLDTRYLTLKQPGLTSCYQSTSVRSPCYNGLAKWLTSWNCHTYEMSPRFSCITHSQVEC